MASEEERQLENDIDSEWSKNDGFEPYNATEAAKRAEELWPDNLQREALPLDKQLKRFIENNADDPEIAKWLPPPPRGPEANRKYILTNSDEISVQYFRPQRKWCCTYGNHKFFSGDPDSVAMMVERSLNPVRDLSEQELLTVARYAQGGMTTEAICAYLSASLGYKEVDDALAGEISCNPKFRNLCDEAVQFVFLNSNQDFTPEPEWGDFVEQFANGRPLTIALLAGARKTWEEKRSSLRFSVEEYRRAKETVDPAEVVRQLNELPDKDLDDLFTNSKRLVVRNRR